MLKGKAGEIYNIAGKKELKNIDVVKTILDLLGKPKSLITFVKDRPGHDLRYSLNIEKIERLGWKPKTVFEEGIKNSSFYFSFYKIFYEYIFQKSIKIIREEDGSKMKILVTGGAGFIGSHLVDKLVELGHDVTVIDNFSSGYEKNLEKVRDKINLIKTDISAKNIYQYVCNQDVIFHLAAIPDPGLCDEHIEETFKSNVEGTFNILFAALRNNVKKVIFLSSAHVYGEPKYLPIDEKHPVEIYNYYTFSKRLGELICDFFIRKHALDVIYFRLFNVYGPKQRLNFFIPTLISQALKNKKIEIWSDKPTRDFIYIDDVIEALIKSIDTNFVGGPINLGYGLEVQTGEVARLVAAKLDSQLVVLNKKVIGPMRLVCNNFKAKEILNWEPKISLSDGLEKTIEWYKENLEYFGMK